MSTSEDWSMHAPFMHNIQRLHRLPKSWAVSRADVWENTKVRHHLCKYNISHLSMWNTSQSMVFPSTTHVSPRERTYNIYFSAPNVRFQAFVQQAWHGRQKRRTTWIFLWSCAEYFDAQIQLKSILPGQNLMIASAILLSSLMKAPALLRSNSDVKARLASADASAEGCQEMCWSGAEKEQKWRFVFLARRLRSMEASALANRPAGTWNTFSL